MEKLFSGLNKYFESVPDALRKRRLLVWGIFLISSVFCIMGIPQADFDVTLKSWFPENDPVIVGLDQFKNEFGSNDGIYIVYKAKDGDVFSDTSLRIVNNIQEDILNYRINIKEGESSPLDHIIKVDTIINAKVMEAKDDRLIAKPLIGKQFPRNEQEREQVRKIALQQKNFPFWYFSENFEYGGIYIQTDFGMIPEETAVKNKDEKAGNESKDLDTSLKSDEVKYKPVTMDEYRSVMEALNAILYKAEYKDAFDYYAVGNAPMMVVFEKITEESGPLFGLMLLVVIALLWILFRSASAMIWTVLIVIVTSLWTVGLTAWSGVTMSSMIFLTVMMILAVGVADSIHIISGYLFFRNKDYDHPTAIRSAFQKSALACLLTSVTTMIGLLSLTFSPIEHIRVFGFSTAIGMGITFILTVYLLPLMLDIWAPVKKKATMKTRKKLLPDFSKIFQSLLKHILPLVEKFPLPIIIIFSLVLGFSILGTTKVKIDSNMIEMLKKDNILRIACNIVDKHMIGTQNMEILIDMDKENAFQDPRVLKALERLQKDIETEYASFIVRTSSFADVVKNSFRVLNEDRDEMEKIPENREILAQTLSAFEKASPEERKQLVTDDFSKSHLSIQLQNAGSHQYTRFFDSVQNDAKAVFTDLKKDYPSMSISVTGVLALVMKLKNYIAHSQAQSLGSVILVISLLLLFIFGSLRVGLIAIIPNIIPAIFTFGLLGLLKIPLDADTMVIAPVIIGISVDDTIHFISHFRSEMIKSNNIKLALENTFKEAGQAIIFTSIILGLSFSILSFSGYLPLVKIGLFGSLAIFIALLCDIILLPNLILIFKPRFSTGTLKRASTTAQPY
jgi:predicted RND superfamily exporter protein